MQRQLITYCIFETYFTLKFSCLFPAVLACVTSVYFRAENYVATLLHILKPILQNFSNLFNKFNKLSLIA